MPRLDGDSACWVHSTDPVVVARRDAARVRGGLNTAAGEADPPTEPVRLRTPEDRLRLLEAAAGDVLRLRNSAARGKTLAVIARAADAIATAAQAEEIETRLSELENQQRSDKW
jgi:hypothetical protein